MNPPEQLTRKELRVAFVLTLIGIAALLSILFLTGCAVIRLGATAPDGKAAHSTLYAVDWPWRDLRQVVNRANVTVKTNSAAISFKGEQDNPINTNALATVDHLLTTTDNLLKKAP